MPGEDALCNWIDIVQSVDDDDANVQSFEPDFVQRLAHQSQSDLLPGPPDPLLRRKSRKDKSICPPRKGMAQISSTILLLGGYVPAVKYTVVVRAAEEGKDGQEGRTIFDLSTEVVLRYKDDERRKNKS